MRSLRLVPAALVIVAVAIGIPAAVASHTAGPATVTIAGSLQSEAGCPGDWQPDCANTHLAYDAADDVWQGSWAVPAGSYEYKAALNDSWSESYGLHTRRRRQHPAHRSTRGPVKFYYDHTSHWITDNKRSVIATAAGSFQSELGCSGRLAAGLPPLVAPGRRRRTAPTRSRRRRFRPGATSSRSPSTRRWDVSYGQGGGSQQRAVHRLRRRLDRLDQLEQHDPCPHRHRHGARRRTPHDQQRRVGRRLRTTRATPSTARPAARSPAGTAVKLRLRTFHDDVNVCEGPRLGRGLAWAQRFVTMQRVASGASLLPALRSSGDFVRLLAGDARQQLRSGRALVPLHRHRRHRDRVLRRRHLRPRRRPRRRRPSGTFVDWSYALTFYRPGFDVPKWAQHAVIYQIFPDRFRNGDPKNDPGVR